MNLEIDGLTFSSKDKAAAHVRKTIFATYGNETPLPEPAARFLHALLERHPRHARKVGCGIAWFFIRINAFWGNNSRGLWLRRTDGSETDFSFRECIWPSSHRNKFNAACRGAIDEQKWRFRDETFACAPDGIVICPLSGAVVTLENCHVHHALPNSFLILLERFCAQEGIDPDTTPVKDHADRTMSDALADDALTERWQAFHRQHAELQLVCKHDHLREKHPRRARSQA